MKQTSWTGIFGLLAPLAAAALLSGCMRATLHSTAEREMTLGVVQKEIRRGLSQADVAAALGSPNIVTKDGEGHETWVYDKVASEASYSTSSAYGNILIVGVSREAGAAATTQKTLTVIIKFDDASRVDSFSYHTSRF